MAKTRSAKKGPASIDGSLWKLGGELSTFAEDEIDRISGWFDSAFNILPRAMVSRDRSKEARLKGAPEKAAELRMVMAGALQAADAAADVTIGEMEDINIEVRRKMVKDMRAVLIMAQELCDSVENAMRPLLGIQATSSRAGHLQALSDVIGVRPLGTWRDEWASLTRETIELQPWMKSNEAVELSIERKAAALAPAIADLVATGWPRERATTYLLLHARKAVIARALRERDRQYAAAIYELCDCIAEQHGIGREGEMTYTHLEGHSGLAFNEPRWRILETPDHTGFRGLTSSALVSTDRLPERFTERGHCAYDFKTDSLVAQDSDVVGFLPLPDSDDGCHAAVSQGAGYVRRRSTCNARATSPPIPDPSKLFLFVPHDVHRHAFHRILCSVCAR